MDRLIARASRRSRAALAALALLGALAGAFLLVAPGDRAAAAGTACRASGPVSAAYTVTVCIEAPADGASLTGPATVTATATVTPAATAQGVQRMIFTLDGEYLLTDYSADATGRYTFTLKTARFTDRRRTLAAQVLLRDGFTSEAASIDLTLANNVKQPPVNTGTFAPTQGTQPAPGAPFVLAASGDGAGGEAAETRVTDLIDSWSPNLFLYLGDVYEKGTATEFDNWYGPAGAAGLYGRFRGITNPTIGNHEYENDVAPGYFDYWDNVPNYYSVNANGWHLVSLNSNAQLGQTGPGSPQYEWLASDLAANVQPCTLVYFHHPRFNIGEEGASTRMDRIWKLMALRGVDLVLTGHDHSYQRWRPLNGAGAPDPAGLTQFVVGTGGHGLQDFIQSDTRVAAALTVFGALRLELNPSGAAYRFVSADGLTLDTGSVACHKAPGGVSDVLPPTAPLDLQATAESRTRVKLGWKPASDNVGVTGYDVYRDGVLLAHAGPEPAFVDATASPGATHSYAVAARDAAGNASAQSLPATATTDPLASLFGDDFESGDLGRWDVVNGLTVGTQHVFSGTRAARASSTGDPAAAHRAIPALTELHYRLRFKLLSRGASSPANLLTFATAAGARLLTLSVSAGGRLAVTGIPSTNASPLITEGVWHTAQVRLVANGASSQTEVWLDGAQVWPLSGPVALAAGEIGRIELGDGVAGHSFDAAFDEVAVDPAFIADAVPPAPPTGLTATAASGIEIDLAWQPSTDDVGVTGYDVYRDCSPAIAGPCEPIATVAGMTAYADTGVTPLSSHFYVVVARDADGNASLPSNAAFADTPVLFGDGFESGDLSRWSLVSGLTVVPSPVNAGAYAARATSTGAGAAHASKSLGAGRSELFARTRFRIAIQAANQVALMRLATSAGAPLLTIAVSPTGKLLGLNGPAGTTAATAVPVTPAVWHELQVRLRVDGASGRSDVWLDGAPVAVLSGPGNFGTTPIARIGIGDDTASGRSYDVAFDEVLADEEAIPDITPPTAPDGLTAAAASPSDVDLAWQPAADNLAVTGYDIHRDGTRVASVGAVTAYRDRGAMPGSAHVYTVFAVDAAGNGSLLPTSATVTMPPPVTSLDLRPVADAYVNADAPATRYGGSSTLRVDATPLTRSYLRFAVSGLAGPAVSATLRVYAITNHSTGYEAFAVTDTDWAEGTITHALAPPFGIRIGASGPATAGTWTSIDVTSLITRNGLFTIGLSTASGTALSLASRESGANAPQLVIQGPSGASSDSHAPSVPTGLAASAVSQGRIDLAWSPATDNVGVTGYTIYRDGAPLASLGAAATAYSDTTVAAAATYTYEVDAVDAAGNRSARSASAGATTPGGSGGSGGPAATALVADAYTKSDTPGTSYGTATTLRADASPIIRSFLRFTVGGLSGPAARATLRVYAPSAHSAGYDVLAVADTSWGETAITHVNSPTLGLKLGASGPIAAGSWTSVDVTPYITGNGAFSLALTTLSNAAMSLSSRESANAPQLVVESASGPGDTQAPTVPSELAANAVSSSRVDLSWAPSTDDVGVTGYAIYRNGALLASVGGGGATYSDTTAAPATTYSYAVDAVDAAGNRSARSASATATTPAAATSLTVTAAADAYTSGDPAAVGANYGSLTTLRADASPLIRSFLRFTVSGLSGPATRVTLRIYGASAHSSGYDAMRVADTSWGETTITHANAPALGTKIGASGAISAGSWTTVDVTPYITGNGTYSLALTTSSGTAMSLASRESANAPRLVIER